MSDEDDATVDDPEVMAAASLVDSIVAAYDRDMLSLAPATFDGVEVQVLCIAVDDSSIFPVAVLMNDELHSHVQPYDMEVTETQPKETDGE